MENTIPDIELPMFTLNFVRYQAEALLIDYSSASTVERVGQTQFWIQVACTAAKLLGQRGAVLKKATGMTTYQYVEC